MIVLVALTLWCQLFVEEIRPLVLVKHPYYVEPAADLRTVDGKNLWQWEEVFCGDTLLSQRQTRVPRMRVLGDKDPSAGQ